MEGFPRCIGGRKDALDFCKGRMLGKDDSFKVVLNPAQYPGADKRGHLGAGQVLPIWKNTGGACSPLTLSGRSLIPDRSREGAGIGAAQLT